MSLFIENFKNDYNNINNIPETIETNEIIIKGSSEIITHTKTVFLNSAGKWSVRFCFAFSS